MMTGSGACILDIECALLWKLSRLHGWGGEVTVSKLVRDAPVEDRERAREIARNQLASRSFIGYHPGRDTIWISGPPSSQLFYHLRDECGYSSIQLQATFSSYLDRF